MKVKKPPTATPSMRATRLLLVLLLVLAVSLAGCPEGGEGGSGYARGDEVAGSLADAVADPPAAQLSSSVWYTSAFVPGSTNT